MEGGYTIALGALHLPLKVSLKLKDKINRGTTLVAMGVAQKRGHKPMTRPNGLSGIRAGDSTTCRSDDDL